MVRMTREARAQWIAPGPRPEALPANPEQLSCKARDLTFAFAAGVFVAMIICLLLHIFHASAKG